MYRGELLLFLLAVGFFSADFLRDRPTIFSKETTLPPKITQWEIDYCTRTIFIQAVAGGIPPYDFYVFRQDELDSSNWQLYRLIKEQLPQISNLPGGNYRIKAVNEGSIPSFTVSSHLLSFRFVPNPEIEERGTFLLCTGASPAISVEHAQSEYAPLPLRWTATVGVAPEGGALLGFTSNSTELKWVLDDTLVNTGNTSAQVSYQLHTLLGGCPIPDRSVVVTVEPMPMVEAKVTNQVVCSGSPFSISLLPKSWGSSPMQVRWSADVLSGQVSGVTEGEGSLSSLAPISQTLSNGGTQPARIRYAIFPSFQGCEGLPESVEIEVIPDLLSVPVQDLVFCPGDRVSIPEFASTLSGAALDYYWEASDSSIGLVRSQGVGQQIPSFLASNAGSEPLQSRITVTPLLLNPEEGISCSGPPTSFWVTVRAPLRIQEKLSNYAGFGVSCSGALDGKIDLEVAGGMLPEELGGYSFSWTGPDGFVSTASNLVGLQAGTYRVQVFGGGNCMLEKNMEITQPEVLQISQSQANNLCFQGTAGSIAITASGGTAPYTYAWTGPNNFSSTNEYLSGLVSGTYQVTVTDGNGCILTGAPLTISEPTQFTLVQSQVNNVCFQGTAGSISIIATGGTAPYTYAWTGPNNFSSSNEDLSGLISGTYQVTVTDANGCTITGAAQTVTEPAQLALVHSQVNNVCFQGTAGNISILAAGGTTPYSYAWTGPNNFSSTLANPQNLLSGAYQVTVTDANGCTITGVPQTITEPTQLTLAQSQVNNVCFQGTAGNISILAAGGTTPYSYAWTGPNGFTATKQELSILVSGTYQVTVTDANGCILTGAPQTITEPTQLTLIQSQVDNVCFQGTAGSISILAAGGTTPYSYAWTGPNGFTATKQELSTLVSGTYQVTVTDANGCILTGAPLTISEPTQFTFIQSQVNNSCFQGNTGSISIIAAGGTAPYSYTWTGPNNFSATVANPQNLASGTYQVTVTDANGCTITGVPQTITEPAQLALTQSQVNNVCFQGNTGSISITATGGTAPYSYTWTGPNNFSATVANPQNLASGTYQVTVTDANGCTITGVPQTITEPAQLALTQSQVNNVCFQGNTGSISITAAGGTAPYTYAWTGPNNFISTSEDLSGLVFGTYQVTVTDANTCTALAGPAITITEPPALSINAQVQSESCADARDGRIELTLTGGTPPYTLTWEHGDTDALATGLGADTYRVRVTDQSGCSREGEYTLLPIAPLSLQTTTTLQATQVPLQISALLQATATGGTPPYTYRWSTGQSTAQITVLESGMYGIEILDSKGCSQESEVAVTLPLPMNLSIEVTTDPLCEEGGQETSVQLQLREGLPPYQITWSRPGASADGRVFTTRESGVFDLEVKDALGLVENRTFTIAPRLTGPLDFSYVFASQAEFQADLVGFAVNFSPQATWPFLVIAWDFGDGNSSALPAPSHRYAAKGTYLVTLTVLDDAGCLIKATQEIQVLDYFIEIPNVFTPNGDALNDTYFPKFRFIRNLQLQVMNKWGELIYRSQGQEDLGWDGFVSGDKAPEGVYVYKLSYQVPDGRRLTSSSTFLLAR